MLWASPHLVVTFLEELKLPFSGLEILLHNKGDGIFARIGPAFYVN